MEENGVHIGKDGWLFLFGGSNEVGRLFTEVGAVSAQDGELWLNVLLNRSHELKRRSVDYYHTWVPDKFSIYPEFTDDSLILLSQSPSELLSLPPPVHSDLLVDLKPALLDAKNDHQVFWKSDTHWTHYGAYAGYTAICKRIGIMALPQILGLPINEAEITLDLGSKLNAPVQERWGAANILQRSKLSWRNSIGKFAEIIQPKMRGELHIGVSVKFENFSAEAEAARVLIFGDSYCEYRPHSLSAMLAETFKEVMFVWSSSIDYGIVDTFRPDIVITEMAERFLKRVPDDSLDREKASIQRMVEILNKECFSERFEFSWNPKHLTSG